MLEVKNTILSTKLVFWGALMGSLVGKTQMKTGICNIKHMSRESAKLESKKLKKKRKKSTQVL